MYRSETWNIKKGEHYKIDTLELWHWRRHLRVPWTARIWNQSILKDYSPEYSLEGLMLKLKLQNFVHLMQKANSLEVFLIWERLRAGEEGDYKGWDGWMASLTQWTQVWANCKGQWNTGKPGVLQFMGLQKVRHYLVTKQH